MCVAGWARALSDPNISYIKSCCSDSEWYDYVEDGATDALGLNEAQARELFHTLWPSNLWKEDLDKTGCPVEWAIRDDNTYRSPTAEQAVIVLRRLADGRIDL